MTWHIYAVVKKSSSLRRGAHISSQRGPFWNKKIDTLISQTVILYEPCQNLAILSVVCAVVLLDRTSARSLPCRLDGTRASSPPRRLDGTHPSCPPRRLDGTRASSKAAHAHREASSLTSMHLDAAHLTHNFSIDGLIKALRRRVFACDPMAAFSLFVFSTRIPP